MNARQKQQLIWIVSLVVLLAGVWWSYDSMVSGRQSALNASLDARKCQQLSEQIRAIMDTPQVASSQELKGTALLQRIDQAAGEINMPSPKKISPQPATRVGENKAYKEKPARVEWDGVSMQQLMTVLYTLTMQEAGLRVKSIEMRGSKNNNRSLWDVNVTLAQLVYDPVTKVNKK